MKICPKCKTFSDGIYCEFDGKELVEAYHNCGKCGHKVIKHRRFCNMCGTKQNK
jgi:uncharacterized OB-fold protein